MGAWALAFGCAVGWGSFVMPGNTFLPIAGPLGTVLGIGIGAVIMLIIAANYHFLMNKFPEAGGAYAYTKHIHGYDHGFLNAWFLILTYVAIIWANATALPLIGRNLLGSFFQVGFHYQIAGFDVYLGEVLLAVAALIAFGTRYVCLAAPAISVIFPACYYWRTGLLVCALVLLVPAVPIFARHWENFVRIREGTEMRTSFIWNKEGELKRIGMWNDKTVSQLGRRGK